MTTTVGRNDPCPCGSGRKYKNCCEGKLQLGRQVRGPWLYVGAAVAAIAIVGVGFTLTRNRATTNIGSPGSVDNTAGPAAAPWTYDSTTNRHFDPVHRHWHDGPPPPIELRGAGAISPMSPGDSGATNPAAVAPQGAPASTPAPWTYDPATNQHWDPNHGHWHPGPPPSTAR